ncbi:MAG: AAA family ATPase [Alloprevotella sp.]|nr:AAA family ATPase [Alloprevotella sp.]
MVANTEIGYIRVKIISLRGKTLTLVSAREPKQKILLYLAESEATYLPPLCKKDVQLNIIRPHFIEESKHRLRTVIDRYDLIVFEPDFLLNITDVAHCFELGSSLDYYLNLLRSHADDSPYPLLGNFASQLLDDDIYHHATPLSYAESAREFMHQNPLRLAASKGLSFVSKEGIIQQHNIHQQIDYLLQQEAHFDIQQTILEPSFVCEMLGLQGRMDLLQENFRFLLEQKSGKNDEFRNTAQESHRVQILLYSAILYYNFQEASTVNYLMYSKYAMGLQKIDFDKTTLQQAIRFRNEIVAHNVAHANQSAKKWFEQLQPIDFRQNPSLSNKFWTNFKLPPIAQFLENIHEADKLAQAYFYRYYRFLQREDELAVRGSATKAVDEVASYWNASLDEKHDNGCILDCLTISDVTYNEQQAITTITCKGSSERVQDIIATSNFRPNDSVIFYAYHPNVVPDIRNAIVFKAKLIALQTDGVKIQLLNPQRNQHLFEEKTWCIEHDLNQVSKGMYRSLYSLLCMDSERRDYFLNLRPSQLQPQATLRGNYGDFDKVVRLALEAYPFSLIIGPPGTGKTSHAIMNIVREMLYRPKSKILLAAYTNQAVDELCDNLAGNDIPYIRLSNLVVDNETAHRFNFYRQVQQCNHINEVRKLIRDTQVVVSTVSHLSLHQEIFALEKFDIAIIDEASQLLEPQVLPLITARHANNYAIDKFVLVGDHKQLPAIVRQSEEESIVKSRILQKSGLTNCRNSLFERLLQRHPQIMLSRQGRMHPDVARFSNQTFYDGRIETVPLPHQCADIGLENPRNPIQEFVSTHRVGFFDIRPLKKDLSNKTNRAEAELIGQLVVEIRDLYERNGLQIQDERTIGCIVPYRNQIALIRQYIRKNEEARGYDRPTPITIDTVERYQGSQRDIILYGFTVHSPTQLSFLTANNFRDATGTLIDRKLNVALTRARKQLFLVGNAPLLQTDSLFKRLISQTPQFNESINSHKA